MPQGAGYGPQKDRAQTSIGGGGNGRAGPAGPGGSIAAAKANQQPQTTNYGAPIHTATGPTYGGIQVARAPAQWAGLVDRVNAYNDAATKWNAGTGRSLANFVNEMAPGGFSMQAPDFNRPATYTGGEYHVGWNPGSLAGFASPIAGGGIVTGMIGSKLYHAFGGNDLVLGGPDVPQNWAMGAPTAPSATQQRGPALGNPTQGGQQAPWSTPAQQSMAAPSPATQGGQSPIPQPNYKQLLAQFYPVLGNYGVNIPGYQYRATV